MEMFLLNYKSAHIAGIFLLLSCRTLNLECQDNLTFIVLAATRQLFSSFTIKRKIRVDLFYYFNLHNSIPTQKMLNTPS